MALWACASARRRDQAHVEAAVEREAEKIATDIAAKPRRSAVAFLGWALGKVWGALFDEVRLDDDADQVDHDHGDDAV